jgi:hypothetical protein
MRPCERRLLKSGKSATNSGSPLHRQRGDRFGGLPSIGAAAALRGDFDPQRLFRTADPPSRSEVIIFPKEDHTTPAGCRQAPELARHHRAQQRRNISARSKHGIGTISTCSRGVPWSAASRFPGRGLVGVDIGLRASRGSNADARLCRESRGRDGGVR